MQTLIPQPASARAQPIGRTGRLLGFGLTPLAMLLIAGGFALAAPAFRHPRRIWWMFAWDAVVLVLAMVDALRLPRPADFVVTRSFLDSPQLGQPTRVQLRVVMQADAMVDLRLVDDLDTALVASPAEQRVVVFPRDAAVSVATVYPRERGDFVMRRVYLRYRGVLRLVERWAAAEPVEDCAAVTADSSAALRNDKQKGLRSDKEIGLRNDNPRGMPQRVRVFPALEESRESTKFYLLRARQIEMQKRRLRLRGTGRDFESLREYQQGDELRNVSWTATARRNKLVSRQFTVERSQQVWIVLDAGRLSRTAFELKRGGVESFSETEAEKTAAHLLSVTQLDQATQAAAMLAQVIHGSGDKFALMAYGQKVQQLLLPGAGQAHLRELIDQLSRTRSERAEGDHLGAMARLKTVQRRRGLIVWVTELTDSVGRPEIVAAAAELVRRHLVVLVLLKHPELDELAARPPRTGAEMFHAAAAQEMIERRRETVAQLERQGVLIVETTAAEVGVNAITKYLEVKAKGML
jgi:uncharacterized protein (DUF58 family)